MTIPKFILGDKVYLRALTREDLRGPFLTWMDDEEVTRYMFCRWRPTRIEEIEAAYDRTIGSNADIEFAICCRSKDCIVGVSGLHDIHWLSRQAEFRIMIGDKSAWGRGYGVETAQLLVRYAFEKLNLNRVSLGVNSEDKRAIRCYEKVGFTDEGISREAVFRNNRYYDAVRMGILRRDYKA
jgi:ribosomal-protein-alanine N-acetyltransferase